jgi:hypothetical protein
LEQFNKISKPYFDAIGFKTPVVDKEIDTIATLLYNF